MPKFKQGNMYDDSGIDVYCVTTNAMLNKHGHLVMGKGVALEAAKKRPILPLAWGKYLQDHNLVGKPYVLIQCMDHIAFQTKLHWRDSSPLDLVISSIKNLAAYAQANPDNHIALPFPGINNGGLSPKDVYPHLVEHLPSNVTVYYLQELNLGPIH